MKERQSERKKKENELVMFPTKLLLHGISLNKIQSLTPHILPTNTALKM